MATELKFQVFHEGLKPADTETSDFVRKLQPGSFVELEYKDKTRGTVPMLRTWRGWMREVARHMSHYGCSMPLYFTAEGKPVGKRPFNKDDAHELFCSKFLGVDDEGRRKSWGMSQDDNPEEVVRASTGDRLWAMDCMLEYAVEKGIKLTIPKNSEYENEKKKQMEGVA